MLKVLSFLCIFTAIGFAMDSLVGHPEGFQPAHIFQVISVQRPKHVLYIIGVLGAVSWFIISKVMTGSGAKQGKVLDLESPSSRRGSLVKATGKESRPQGTWLPVEFQRPAPQPLLDWDVRKTKPRPYRPFKWGPYHTTMGLRAMQWDEWIELDNHYLKYHADKKRRIEERGSRCCRTAPEAMDGAIELLEELCALSSRQRSVRY